jgi:hypothetical protein
VNPRLPPSLPHFFAVFFPVASENGSLETGSTAIPSKYCVTITSPDCDTSCDTFLPAVGSDADVALVALRNTEHDLRSIALAAVHQPQQSPLSQLNSLEQACAPECILSVEPILFQRSFDARQQRRLIDWFRKEVNRSPFHRSDRRWDVPALVMKITGIVVSAEINFCTSSPFSPGIL